MARRHAVLGRHLGARRRSRVGLLYAAVLGWEMVDSGEEFGHHRIAQVDGRAAAGLGPVTQEGTPTAWTLYFAGDDVDGTAELVTEHGGTLLFEPGPVRRHARPVRQRLSPTAGGPLRRG